VSALSHAGGGEHSDKVCVCLLLQDLVQICLHGGGGGNVGGHVLGETTSRGLCGLVCPSRTSERGGAGDCVKEGGGERREVREGACIGAATILHPWTLRLILNATTLAAASPTLLFRPW
jgi:hypothetical protein